MHTQLLTQFGFTANDIAIYDTLIKEGSVKTGVIIKRSGVTSSRVYTSLEKLLESGLVTFQVRNNIRYYQAESPDVLLRQIDEQREGIEELMRHIALQKNEEKSRNGTNVYEGEYGFKKAFVQHVAMCNKKETLQIIGFSPRLYNSKTLRSFMRRLDSQVTDKQLCVQIILDSRFKKTFGSDKKQLKNYEVRYMPTGYFSPVAINLSQREVMISVWGEEPTAFVLSNPLVISSFRQNFEFLWKASKKSE